MKLFDTTIPKNFSNDIFQTKNYDLSDSHTDKIIEVTFTAVSNILNDAKSKDHPVAFKFVNIGGSLIAAAIVQYFENEDSSKPGNWNLVWTFNEEDIPSNSMVLDLNNAETHPYFRAVAAEKGRFTFNDVASLVTLTTYVLIHIKKWLDENAVEGKEISVEQDAIFQARVAIEDGKKVFAIEPAGEMKMLIKDDAAIEK